MDTTRVTIHMVSSLDGIIAKKDNSVSWFESADNYENGVSGENAEEFMKTIDCFVMGARTYEHAVELSKEIGWAFGDVRTIVVSHRNLPIVRESVEMYSGELNKLVNERLKPDCKNVWLVGGAILSMDFLRSGLADELRLSVMPIILGEGTRFFDHIGREQQLHLKETTAYKNGMVELRYEIRK
jgi:dihydrofolate reductase